MQSHIRMVYACFSCNLPPALLAAWPGSFTCDCKKTKIRVSIESRPWRRKFSHCFCRDSNLRPFSHESGALTTELSPPWGGNSSVGRSSDWKAEVQYWCWLESLCGKGFFSQSQISVQTLSRCPCSPCEKLHGFISVCSLKLPNTGSQTIAWTLHTLTGMGRAALVAIAAVPYPQARQPTFPTRENEVL